jgi:hypothetical protein
MRRLPAIRWFQALAFCGAAVLHGGCVDTEDVSLPDWEFCPDLHQVEYDLLYVPGVKYQIYSLYMEARLDGRETRTYWVRASAPIDQCYRSTDAESSVNHRHVIEFLRAVRSSETAELTALRC